MRTRRLSHLLLIACAFLVAGCTVTDRDVSRDEHFLVGYRPGEIYRLTQPVCVLALGDGTFELLPLGATREYGKPEGTLAEGTRIEIVSLRHVVVAAPVQWETRVDTEAQIVNQPDRVFFLNDVSGVRWIDGDHRMKTPVLTPDPKWLELVTPVRSGTTIEQAVAPKA
jgi:hypothetical protein